MIIMLLANNANFWSWIIKLSSVFTNEGLTLNSIGIEGKKIKIYGQCFWYTTVEYFYEDN